MFFIMLPSHFHHVGRLALLYMGMDKQVVLTVLEPTLTFRTVAEFECVVIFFCAAADSAPVQGLRTGSALFPLVDRFAEFLPADDLAG